MIERARPGSTSSRIVALSAVIAAFMIAQQIAAKAVRDGFFLSEWSVTVLPVATLAAAIVSFVAALFLGKFIASFSPAGAVPVLFGANSLLFFVEAALVGTSPRVIAAAIFLHTAAFGGAVVSGFWSVVNERFDPYTARKVMGQIAGGATFGGVLGGGLTWLFSDVPIVLLLVGFGISSVLCAVAIGFVARGGEGSEAGKPKREPAALLAGFTVLTKSSYPRTIAILVFLAALMTGLVDYVFKAGVVEATSGGSLVGFFAIFYTATGVTTFLVQAGTSRHVLKALGVVPTVGALPVVAFGLLLIALLSPALVTLVLLRGGAMVIENSLYRSGYELLYTAVPREQKRSAKVLIDLGCDRLGTAAASGLALLVIALAVGVVDRILLLSAMAVALAILGMLVVARSEYVGSLAAQLRTALESNTPQQDEADAAKALATTFVADMDLWEDVGASTAAPETTRSEARLSRKELLDEVNARAEKKRSTADDSAPSSAAVSMVSERLLATPLRQRLRDAEEDGGVAWAELQRSAPGTIGQLGDLLLSARESIDTRLRAVELMATVPSRRAADALLEALSTPELRLRRAAALAMLKICSAAPALVPPRRELAELAEKELRRPSRPVRSRSEFELASPFLKDARGNDLDSTLELVFLLLAIGGETAQLRLALSAITSEDAGRRGTGLEYLDNLLPTHLRGRLIALAEHPELTQADQRLSTGVVQVLAEELRRGELSIRELREKVRQAKRDAYDRQRPPAALGS